MLRMTFSLDLKQVFDWFSSPKQISLGVNPFAERISLTLVSRLEKQLLAQLSSAPTTEARISKKISPNMRSSSENLAFRSVHHNWSLW